MAASLDMMTLQLVFSNKTLAEAMGLVSELIRAHLSPLQRWGPLKSQDEQKMASSQGYKAPGDSGLIDFWLACYAAMPEPGSDGDEAEVFDIGLIFLKYLISVGARYDEEKANREAVLTKIINALFRRLCHREAKDQRKLSPEQWREFLEICSHELKLSAKCIDGLANEIGIATVYWLMTNMYDIEEGPNGSSELTQLFAKVSISLWRPLTRLDPGNSWRRIAVAKILAGPLSLVIPRSIPRNIERSLPNLAAVDAASASATNRIYAFSQGVCNLTESLLRIAPEFDQLRHCQGRSWEKEWISKQPWQHFHLESFAYDIDSQKLTEITFYANARICGLADTPLSARKKVLKDALEKILPSLTRMISEHGINGTCTVRIRSSLQKHDPAVAEKPQQDRTYYDEYEDWETSRLLQLPVPLNSSY